MKSKKNLKNQVVTSRVTLEEKKLYSYLANELDISISEWINETLNNNNYSYAMFRQKEEIIKALKLLEVELEEIKIEIKRIDDKKYLSSELSDRFFSGLKLLKAQLEISKFKKLLEQI